MGAPSVPIKLRFNAKGKYAFALYAVDEETWPGGEEMWHVTKPGEMLRVEVKPNSSVYLCSTDMKYRAKITASLNNDPSEKERKLRPWSLEFKNMMMEDEYSLELKHSTSGYVWVLPGTQVLHQTDFDHFFDLRDKKKEIVCQLSVEHPDYDPLKDPKAKK